MRILLYHGKLGLKGWLASTREQLEAAMKALFLQLDTEGHYSCTPREFYQNFALARRGDFRQIKAILNMRNGREGETWELLYVGDPLR